ncbi:hypothetical protein BV898_13996 [Hypsibius exemplaris]|uniref:Uncharacterized protein n=1 Tax=Hypsibius exemplaris TaxID=2072580 RepID=A0A1W0W945_HYPEX|nr:hypothetical protein BV898_13996 [Hypsibius exemplaris]
MPALIIPKIPQYNPPTIGSGMVAMRAPNLDRIPIASIVTAAQYKIRRDPTYEVRTVEHETKLVRADSLYPTFVIPKAAIFSAMKDAGYSRCSGQPSGGAHHSPAYEVVPEPVPHIPAKMQPIPSMAMPRLT